MRWLYMFTAETQRTLRKRRVRGKERSPIPSLRFLSVLRVSAVKKYSAVKTYCHLFSPSYKTRQSFLLFLFFITSCIAPLATRAQTGEITGRVVAEDGAGLPSMIVFLNAVAGDGQAISGVLEKRTFTDLDGHFRFTGLGQGPYSISVSNVKGYVRKPLPENERQNPVYYRTGDNVTIRMIKGGAISGKVRNAFGEPLIGVQVNAVMIRDAEGKPFRAEGGGHRRFTDDRGAYRLYGLPPGTYIVFTRNNATSLFPTPYDGDVPTYHPSSTRDTAAEVSVTSGGEATGIDISYRVSRGHTLSGLVKGGKSIGDTPAVSVFLFDITAATSAGSSYISPGGGRGFTFPGLPDGEYTIIARTSGEDSGMASAPRRISLKGADLPGIELNLLPLGSISGRIIAESSPAVCDGNRKISLQEFSPMAIHEDLKKGDLAVLPWRNFSSLPVNEKGEFTINDVDPGHYRIGLRLTDQNLYLKAITATANVPARRGAPAAVNKISRNGFALKQGEKLTGVKVTVAEGAASMRGKIGAEKDGALLPERLRVYLIPAEPNAADDVLRYAESAAAKDGAFEFKNMAPGKYRMVVRVEPDAEPIDTPPAPPSPDANERAKLRNEVESLKTEVELKPCQRVIDQVIVFSKE